MIYFLSFIWLPLPSFPLPLSYLYHFPPTNAITKQQKWVNKPYFRIHYLNIFLRVHYTLNRIRKHKSMKECFYIPYFLDFRTPKTNTTSNLNSRRIEIRLLKYIKQYQTCTEIWYRKVSKSLSNWNRSHPQITLSPLHPEL